jgi:hypothetical protein
MNEGGGPVQSKPFKNGIVPETNQQNQVPSNISRFFRSPSAVEPETNLQNPVESDPDYIKSLRKLVRGTKYSFNLSNDTTNKKYVGTFRELTEGTRYNIALQITFDDIFEENSKDKIPIPYQTYIYLIEKPHDLSNDNHPVNIQPYIPPQSDGGGKSRKTKRRNTKSKRNKKSKRTRKSKRTKRTQK